MKLKVQRRYIRSTPSRDIFARKDSTASSLGTDSNGCVQCSMDNMSCPNCDDDEECRLSQQTCDSCPKYSCEKKDGVSSSSSSTPIGGIVGGVVGGVVALLALAALYYFFVYRKKHPRLEEDDMKESIIFDDLEGDSTFSSSNRNSLSSHQNSPAMEKMGAKAPYQETPIPRRMNANNNNNSNKRISSYESFMRPKTRAARGKPRRVKNSVGPRRGQGGRNPYLDPNSNVRNSVATSISTTNASNILPIAYIPGVTVRPTKNNTRSIYSYETESLFSDWNTIENASIIGDNSKAVGNGTDKQYTTTTAIKAQPKLVNVDRIEEENEDISEEEEDYDEYGNIGSDLDSNSGSQSDSTEFSKLKSNNDSSQFNNSTLINIAENVIEEESDSDVDSDIGEIARVASVSKKNTRAVNSGPQDVLIDIPMTDSETKDPGSAGNATSTLKSQNTDLQGPHAPHQPGDSPHASSAGSFVLNVEFDDHHSSSRRHSLSSSGSNSNKSPFDDPQT